ncbi:MAG TPA: cellulose biosynthesis protein BcsS [Methylocystis sp.]|nr:cellulose biosynthesis protein BcsS [Methylocystis sp.]
MRRLVLSLSTLVVSAASLAAPIDEGAALRPTLPPQSDPPSKTASRFRSSSPPPPPRPLFSIRGGAEIRAPAFDGRSGAVRPFSFLDLQDAGLPNIADHPFLATENLDSALRRQLSGTSLQDWQYFFIGGRPPAWITAGAAYDFFKRQDRADWGLGHSSWKGGWEIDLAPTAATMAYARGLNAEAARRALVEGKLGFAVFDDVSLPVLPVGKLYLGPFAMMHGLRFDEDAKLGMHMTFGEIGAFHIGVAGGYARGRFGEGGAFGLLESSFRF